MPWSRSTEAAAGIPEVESIDECSRLMRKDLVVLFKHSPTCPVSWMAHREVLKLRVAHPELPLHLISVRRRRDVSSFVADQTGIEHESPQILIFQKGRVVANASHNEVTAEFVCRSAGLRSGEETLESGHTTQLPEAL